ARRRRARSASLHDAHGARSAQQGRGLGLAPRPLHEAQVSVRRIARLRAFADACDPEAAAEVTAELAGRGDEAALAVAAALASAYPAMRGLVTRRFDAVMAIAREGFRAPRRRPELVRRLLAACRAEGEPQ